MVTTNKHSKTVIFLFLLLLGCKERYENLELSREDYNGKELKTNGYYYRQAPKYTDPFFLYQNGVIYFPGITYDTDLDKVDVFTTNIPPLSREDRAKWGIFQVKGATINIETWDIVSGGKIPTNIRAYTILNDTTITIKDSKSGENIIYKFRAFSPKPDSTNNFIK
jgi:hypothetical protein